MVAQCCVCAKIRNGARWEKPEPTLSPEVQVTTSYCPICADEARADMHYTRLESVRPITRMTPTTAG